MTRFDAFVCGFLLAVVQGRHDELAQCHKQDDCHLLAKGIWLALDDVNEKLGGE